jgi:hypothetical protein
MKKSIKMWAMGYALRLVFGNKSENTNNKKETIIVKKSEEPTILKNKEDINNFLNKLK